MLMTRVAEARKADMIISVSFIIVTKNMLSFIYFCDT